MAQAMEFASGSILRAFAGVLHRSGLMRRPPLAAVLLGQEKGVRRPSGSLCGEERHALVGKDDMPPLPAFAGPDMERPAIGVEIRNSKARKLAVARARRKRAADKQAEVGR